jgi:hypothetical protein
VSCAVVALPTTRIKPLATTPSSGMPSNKAARFMTGPSSGWPFEPGPRRVRATGRPMRRDKRSPSKIDGAALRPTPLPGVRRPNSADGARARGTDGRRLHVPGVRRPGTFQGGESEWTVTEFQPMRRPVHVGDDGSIRVHLEIDIEWSA